MYQTTRHFITPEMNITEILFENPSLLIILEHFELDYVVNDKTVKQICIENDLNTDLFLAIINLYNGFINFENNDFTERDITTIIKFLRNGHQYYKNEKYPEIKALIELILTKNDNREIQLLDEFFDDYFEEVLDHLNYEESIVFPYINDIIARNPNQKSKFNFSANEYREHHSDIESKLSELTNLLLRYIPIKNDTSTRRVLIKVLFELDFDLIMHSKIEDEILIPLISKLESKFVND